MAERTVEETLALVRGLAEVAKDYRLDKVSVGDVVLIRTQHVSVEERALAVAKAAMASSNEGEDLFASRDA